MYQRRLFRQRALPISHLVFGLLMQGCSTDNGPTSPLEPASPRGEIEETGEIVGLVTADGTPVSGVTVTLSRSGFDVATSATDGNGEYGFLGLAPGMYVVVVSDFGGMHCVNVRTATVVGGEETEVGFTCATPPARGSVRGRVTLNGVGAGSVVVSLREGARTIRTISSDFNGAYLFRDVPVGLKSVQIHVGEVSCPATSMEVTVTADGTAEADFPCSGQVVTGRGTVDGVPRPNMMIQVCQPVNWDSALLCRSSFTDLDGRYSFTSLPRSFGPTLGPGDYLVVAAAPAVAICPDPQSISLRSGETVTVDIACVSDSTEPAGEGYWDY